MHVNQDVVNWCTWISGALVLWLMATRQILQRRLKAITHIMSSWWLMMMLVLTAPQSAHASGDPWLSTETTLVATMETGAQVTVAEPIKIEQTETYTVLKGDSLWMIAQRHVRSEETVSALWLSIIDENVGSLVSGNPNLIFPGEHIAITHNS